MPLQSIQGDFRGDLLSGASPIIENVTDSPGPEDGLAEEFRQQYPTEANEAFDPPYTFHEEVMRQARARILDLSGQAEAYRVAWRTQYPESEDEVRREVLMDESVDMPDEAPVGHAEDVVMMDEAVTLDPHRRSFRDLLRPARRERVSEAVLNIWITVRQNKHAERVSLRVGTDLIPFEREDVLSWSRHEFEEWAHEHLASLCDSFGNTRDEDWFDVYQWAREQVDARAASFYAIKEREADAA